MKVVESKVWKSKKKEKNDKKSLKSCSFHHLLRKIFNAR